MATGVWDAILFLTKGLVDHMSLLEMCNMGGKPVTKRMSWRGVRGSEERLDAF